jgi:hypothetical protein
MSFSVRKQKQTENISIEEQILNSTEIKSEDDLRKFLLDVSKNGTDCRQNKKNKKTSGFSNRPTKYSSDEL